MKKQTAVEWFFMTMNIRGLLPNDEIVECYEQAKEMEKEQIINAVEWGNRKGYDEHTLTCIYDDDLKYYEETYTQSLE